MHAAQIAEDFPVVSMDTEALHAVRLLADQRLPGIVVTDASGRPVSILPASQVVRFLVPSYVQDDPSLAGVLGESLADRMAEVLNGKTVRTLLPAPAPELPSVDIGDTMIEVAAVMARLRCPLVAVMDGPTMIGVITASRLLGLACPMPRPPSP